MRYKIYDYNVRFDKGERPIIICALTVTTWSTVTTCSDLPIIQAGASTSKPTLIFPVN